MRRYNEEDAGAGRKGGKKGAKKKDGTAKRKGVKEVGRLRP